MSLSDVLAVNIGGATFFDVRNDGWLGKQNQFLFITEPTADKRVLVMRNNGIALMKTNRALVKHLQSAVPADTDIVQRSDDMEQFSLYATYLALTSAALKNSDKLYNKLKMLDRFTLLHLDGKQQGTLENVAKNTLFSKKRAFEWSHSEILKDGTMDKSCKSFIGATSGVLIITEAERERLQSMLQSDSYLDGYTPEEYRSAAHTINTSVLLIAKALGPKATFDILSYATGNASVKLGKATLLFSVTPIDTIDLTLTIDGLVAGTLSDVMGITEYLPLTNGIIPVKRPYCSVAAEAYGLFLQHTATPLANAA